MVNKRSRLLLPNIKWEVLLQDRNGQRVVERFTRGGHTIQTSHGDTLAMDTHHAHMHGSKHMIHSTSCRHCPEQTAGEREVVISGAAKRRNNSFQPRFTRPTRALTWRPG